ncbi:MAG: hypothetical protein KGI51_03290 [Rhodospirillales bacterium]|nr:hypothetical protein [Rhodospirillales bacterium]
MPQPPRPGRRPGGKPFPPAIGRDFDIADATVIEARTHGVLARGLASFAGAAVMVTGLYGLATRRFAPLQITWAVAGPLVGAVVSTYFGLDRRDFR